MGAESEGGERAGPDRLQGGALVRRLHRGAAPGDGPHRRAPPHPGGRGHPAGRPSRSRALRHPRGDGHGHPDRRVVNVLHAGDYFGELAAIEAAPRSATVTATTDLDVLIVGPREFEAMMEIPGFRNALLSGMSRRIREADDRLAAYVEREDPMPDLPRGHDRPLTRRQPGAAASCANRCNPMAQRGLLRVAQEHGHPLLVTVPAALAQRPGELHLGRRHEGRRPHAAGQPQRRLVVHLGQGEVAHGRPPGARDSGRPARGTPRPGPGPRWPCRRTGRISS